MKRKFWGKSITSLTIAATLIASNISLASAGPFDTLNSNTFFTRFDETENSGVQLGNVNLHTGSVDSSTRQNEAPEAPAAGGETDPDQELQLPEAGDPSDEGGSGDSSNDNGNQEDTNSKPEIKDQENETVKEEITKDETTKDEVLSDYDIIQSAKDIALGIGAEPRLAGEVDNMEVILGSDMDVLSPEIKWNRITSPQQGGGEDAPYRLYFYKGDTASASDSYLEYDIYPGRAASDGFTLDGNMGIYTLNIPQLVEKMKSEHPGEPIPASLTVRISLSSKEPRVDNGVEVTIPIFIGANASVFGGTDLNRTGSSAENPFAIDTPERLAWLRRYIAQGIDFKDQYFVQTADIDFKNDAYYDCQTSGSLLYIDVPTNSSGEPDETKVSFAGTYDGAAHKIKNVNFKEGLFFHLRDGAMVKNVHIGVNQKDTDLKTQQHMGYRYITMPAEESGIIQNGGGSFARSMQDSTIVNSFNAATVGDGNANYAGGIVGKLGTGSKLLNSYNAGIVKGKVGAGGLAYSIANPKANAGTLPYIVSCYNVGELIATDNPDYPRIGGIFSVLASAETQEIANEDLNEYTQNIMYNYWMPKYKEYSALEKPPAMFYGETYGKINGKTGAEATETSGSLSFPLESNSGFMGWIDLELHLVNMDQHPYMELFKSIDGPEAQAKLVSLTGLQEEELNRYDIALNGKAGLIVTEDNYGEAYYYSGPPAIVYAGQPDLEPSEIFPADLAEKLQNITLTSQPYYMNTYLYPWAKYLLEAETEKHIKDTLLTDGTYNISPKLKDQSKDGKTANFDIWISRFGETRNYASQATLKFKTWIDEADMLEEAYQMLVNAKGYPDLNLSSNDDEYNKPRLEAFVKTALAGSKFLANNGVITVGHQANASWKVTLAIGSNLSKEVTLHFNEDYKKDFTNNDDLAFKGEGTLSGSPDKITLSDTMGSSGVLVNNHYYINDALAEFHIKTKFTFRNVATGAFDIYFSSQDQAYVGDTSARYILRVENKKLKLLDLLTSDKEVVLAETAFPAGMTVGEGQEHTLQLDYVNNTVKVTIDGIKLQFSAALPVQPNGKFGFGINGTIVTVSQFEFSKTDGGDLPTDDKTASFDKNINKVGKTFSSAPVVSWNANENALSVISNANRPQSILFSVRNSGGVTKLYPAGTTAGSATELGDISSLAKTQNNHVVPVLDLSFVTNKEEAVAIANDLVSKNLLDVAFVSKDQEILKAATQSHPYARGILDWSASSDPNVKRITAAMNKSGAQILLLSDSQVAANDIIRQIHSRMKMIWVKTEGKEAVYRTIARGVDGILTNDYATVNTTLNSFDPTGKSGAGLNKPLLIAKTVTGSTTDLVAAVKQYGLVIYDKLTAMESSDLLDAMVRVELSGGVVYVGVDPVTEQQLLEVVGNLGDYAGNCVFYGEDEAKLKAISASHPEISILHIDSNEYADSVAAYVLNTLTKMFDEQNDARTMTASFANKNYNEDYLQDLTIRGIYTAFYGAQPGMDQAKTLWKSGAQFIKSTGDAKEMETFPLKLTAVSNGALKSGTESDSTAGLKLDNLAPKFLLRDGTAVNVPAANIETIVVSGDAVEKGKTTATKDKIYMSKEGSSVIVLRATLTDVPDGVLYSEPITLTASENPNIAISINIIGEMRYQEELEAVVSPASTEGTYQWYRDGEPIGSEALNKYSISEEDVDHYLSVSIKLADGTIITSPQRGPVEAAEIDSPGSDVTVEWSDGIGKITVPKENAYEYKKYDKEDPDSEERYLKIESGTVQVDAGFYQIRVNDGNRKSLPTTYAISESFKGFVKAKVQGATNQFKAPVIGDVLEIENGIQNGSSTAQWKIIKNNELINAQGAATNATYTLGTDAPYHSVAVNLKDIMINGETMYTSATKIVEKLPYSQNPGSSGMGEMPQGLDTKKASTADSNDGQIINLNINYNYQYRLAGKENTPWEYAVKASATIEGLTAGKYEVRFAETDTYQGSESVTVIVGAEEQVLAGTVTISGTPKTGTRLVANTYGIINNVGAFQYQWYYYVNAENKTKITNATKPYYDLTENDEGERLVVEVTSEGVAGSRVSDPTEPVERVKIKQASPTENFTVVNATTQGGEGKISGFDTNKSYDWKTASGSWAQLQPTNGSISCVAGIYEIRYSENDYYLPSDSVEVRVGTGTEFSGYLKITGVPAVGKTLKPDLQYVNNSSGITGYKWGRVNQNGDVVVIGEGETYTLADNDFGFEIQLTATKGDISLKAKTKSIFKAPESVAFTINATDKELLKLDWMKPKDNGGEITKYTVYLYVDSADPSNLLFKKEQEAEEEAVQTYSHKQYLDTKKKYYVAVTATNAAGESKQVPKDASIVKEDGSVITGWVGYLANADAVPVPSNQAVRRKNLTATLLDESGAVVEIIEADDENAQFTFFKLTEGTYTVKLSGDTILERTVGPITVTEGSVKILGSSTNRVGVLLADISGNGYVDADDLKLMLPYMNGAGGYNSSVDVDGDGNINMKDVEIYLRNTGKDSTAIYKIWNQWESADQMK